ncbi:MAG: hypothetical protein E7314_00455 [Clostridiales bacterium]|nr:hypothetical protein [Clostridiales bacterium]
MEQHIEELKNDLKSGLKEYKQTLWEFIITLFIMLTAWIVLGILNYIGVESKFLAPLNFLTASLNGFENNGWFGFLGGIIAKVTLLMLITQTLIPIVKEAIKPKDKEISKGKFNTFKLILKSIFEQGASLSGYIILGGGIALLIYAFLSVNGNLQNSFVIVLAIFSTIRALATQTGVLIRIVTILSRKMVVNMLPVYSLLIGMSIGFTVSVSLAAIFSSALLGYLLGFSIVLIGWLAIIITKRKYCR